MASKEKEPEVSPMNASMRKLEDNIVQGVAPGTGMKKVSVHLEGLGYLDDFPTQRDTDGGEGTGDKCVVLHDFVSGAGGIGYDQGQIVRLSKLINGYDDENVHRDVIKVAARRLLESGAIRLATDEEVDLDRIEIYEANETPQVRAEREKRIAAETENRELKAKLGMDIDPDPEFEEE